MKSSRNHVQLAMLARTGFRPRSCHAATAALGLFALAGSLPRPAVAAEPAAGREAWMAELPEVRAGRWNITQLWVNGRRAEWAESCRRATVGDNEIANGGHREHQGVGVLVGPRKPPGPASAPETAPETTRVKGERIIDRTTAAWQSQQIQEPCILENPKDPDRLIMFYSGVPAADRGTCFVGKAWALKSEPFVWHQDPDNPVFKPAANGWDSRSLRLDCVLYIPEEDAYYIFYSATDRDDAQDRIGLAICPAGEDGYSGVTPETIRRSGTKPVLAPEPAEPFCETMASQSAVFRERDATG